MKIRFTEVANSLRFPEAPVPLADGSVLVAEIAAAAVSRVYVDGSVERVAKLAGGPNGLAIGPDGRCFVCNNGGRFAFVERSGLLFPSDTPADHRGGSIQRLDLASGSVETLYEVCDGKRLLAPNDITFDTAGGFWFTDYGTSDAEGSRFGAVYYAAADGSRITCAARGIHTPNGIGLSPDGATLYVADTHTGRLWSRPIVAPGTLGVPPPGMPGTLVANLAGYKLFDSLAVEAGGRVCVGTLVDGGISVVDPRDGSIEHVPTDDPMTTNIAFGGLGYTTAWVTASATGRLLKADWPRPGSQLAYEA